MLKRKSILLLGVLTLSGVVSASEEESSQSDEISTSLVAQLFESVSFHCRNYPDCEVDEEEKMTLESERESQLFQTSQKAKSEDPTKKN